MAGTGLPTGGDGRPVLLQPSPLVASEGVSADAWGQTAAAAKQAASSFMSLADEAAKAEKIKYLTDLDLKARDTRIQLYDQHRDDPEGFNAAWKGYTDGVLGGVKLEYADFARQKLEENRLSVIDNIYANKFQKTKQLAGDSVNARIQAAETDLTGIAYRAGGVNSPEFARAADVARNTLADAVNAKLISPEHAALQFDRLMSKAQGESIVGMAKRLYDEKGLEGGYREAENLLSDPALKLDPQQLEAYRGRVAAEMNKWEAFRNTDLTQAKAGAAEMKKRLDDGLPVDDGSVDAMVQQLRAKGGEVEAAQLLQSRNRYEVNRTTALLPLDQHARFIEDMRTRATPLVDRIIGAENATGNPAAKNPNSSATGDGQFIEKTWLSTFRQHFPDAAAGKSDADLLALRKDRDWSRRMVDAYASDNRAFLAGKGLPTDDGAVYLAHFAGPQGAADVLSASPNTPVRALLSDGAIEANAGMKIGNKPFGEWTAGDLRSWAARKVASSGVDPQMVKDAEAALTRKREALNNDPLHFATDAGLIAQVPPVDWAKPDAAAAALADRQRSAMVTAQAYKLGPVPVFNRAELDQLKSTWDQGDAGTRARIVGTLARGLDGAHLTATLEKVAGDNPVFASAGLLYQQAPELALSVVRGQSQIDLDRKILPPEKNIRTEVNDFLGSAAASMPKARDAIERAAIARYADLSASAKDFSGTFDSSRMKQALQDVTGGVVTWGQGTKMFGLFGSPKIIPPKPGMDDSAFAKMMDGLTDDDLAGATTGSGTAIKAADFRRLASLHDAGPGRYLVEIGGGFARGADGKPFVLDLSRKVQ